MARTTRSDLLPDAEIQTARIESLKLVVQVEILVAQLEEHTTDLEMLIQERRDDDARRPDPDLDG